MTNSVCNVIHRAYCGMPEIVAEGVTHEEAREIACKRIKQHRRNDRPTYLIEPGRKWELGESDDEFMVPDDCGILTIEILAHEEEFEEFEEDEDVPAFE